VSLEFSHTPSKELLQSYKDEKIDRKIFWHFFCSELIDNKKNLELCKQIAIESLNGKNITLLCYEKEELSCHRHYVKRIYNQELSKIKARMEYQDNKTTPTDYMNV